MNTTAMNRKGAKWVAIGGVLALTFTLGACSSGSAESSSSGGTDSNSVSALTVGLVDFDTTSITSAAFTTQTKAAMEDEGWEVLTQDPKGDLAQANSICAQYVTRQVDAIVVNVFAMNQMAQCMTQAQSAEIPVFYIGSPLEEGMAGAVDNNLPKPVNDMFIDTVEKMGSATVLEIGYSPGTPCRVRAENFEADVAASSADLTVTKHETKIPGQVTDSQAAADAWLAANPDADDLVIWACSSDMALGTLAALEQRGKADVPIFTWDFNEPTVQPLHDDKLSAVLWLDATGIGQQMTEMVGDYIASGTPLSEEAAYFVVTPENIDQFVKDNPEALQ